MIGVVYLEKNLVYIGLKIMHSKADFYDLKTNYFMAYSSIFELLSNRKKK
jgi:hypothetical protein